MGEIAFNKARDDRPPYFKYTENMKKRSFKVFLSVLALAFVFTAQPHIADAGEVGNIGLGQNTRFNNFARSERFRNIFAGNSRLGSIGRPGIVQQNGSDDEENIRNRFDERRNRGANRPSARIENDQFND